MTGIGKAPEQAEECRKELWRFPRGVEQHPPYQTSSILLPKATAAQFTLRRPGAPCASLSPTAD